MVDKLTCLAATFLEYEQDEWFDRAVAVLAQIYAMPVGKDEARRFAFATWIDPAEVAPRVWLLVIARVYGLGALAVRLRNAPASAAWTRARRAWPRRVALPDLDPCAAPREPTSAEKGSGARRCGIGAAPTPIRTSVISPRALASSSGVKRMTRRRVRLVATV